MPLCAAIRLRSLSNSSTARTSAARYWLAVDPDQEIVSEDLALLVTLLMEMLVPCPNLIPLIFTCQRPNVRARCEMFCTAFGLLGWINEKFRTVSKAGRRFVQC